MKKSHTDTILMSIKTGKVRLRSAWSIWVEKMGTGGAIAGTIALMALIGGMISFWLAANQDLFSNQYGYYGVATLAESFPYLPVILFGICFLILAVLLRKFDFSYKKPLLGILALILIAISVASYVINREPVSQAFIRRSAGYMGMMRGNGANFVLGTVKTAHGSMYSVEKDDGSTVVVNATDTTHYPVGIPKAGDSVRAVGSWSGTVFSAFSIRVFTGSDDAFQGSGRGMRQGGGMGKGIMRGAWDR